jgi:hypothetical protein
MMNFSASAVESNSSLVKGTNPHESPHFSGLILA